MFSLISLYFSYRRDVVLAERYVAGLAEKPVAAQQQAPAIDAPIAPMVRDEPISLAA